MNLKTKIGLLITLSALAIILNFNTNSNPNLNFNQLSGDELTWGPADCNQLVFGLVTSVTASCSGLKCYQCRSSIDSRDFNEVGTAMLGHECGYGPFQ